MPVSCCTPPTPATTGRCSSTAAAPRSWPCRRPAPGRPTSRRCARRANWSPTAPTSRSSRCSSAARRGIVVGAYGLAFSTDDGGATWTSRIADVDNPGGLHLNAVRSVGGATYIAGEKGLLLRSDDGANGSGSGNGNGTNGANGAGANAGGVRGRFTALTSPYDGSWFALDAVAGGPIVVAGLRGNAYASDDAGASWHKLDVPAGVTLSQASKTSDGRLLFVDQSGAVLALKDRRLVPLALPPGAPVTALAQASDGTLVATTFRGPLRLPLDAAAVSVTSAVTGTATSAVIDAADSAMTSAAR